MKSLKNLSDKDLLNHLSKLVKKEHDLTLEILGHLIEVERRKIYRGLGYSSMYAYCTGGLGYSESSASRRIYAARAIGKCPPAYESLRRGWVNLGTLSLVWQHLTPGLLEQIRGKSYWQVQAIVSRFNPMMKHRDITRPVTVRKVAAAEGQITGAALNCSSGPFLIAGPESGPQLGEITLRRGGKKLASEMKPDCTGASTRENIPLSLNPAEVTMETVTMHQVNCLLDDDVVQMLDRCKELMSGKYPTGIDYNTIMRELASSWLDRHDPLRRSERCKKRKNQNRPKSSRKPETVRRSGPASRQKSFEQKEPSRYISQSIREAVYRRDGGRCSYIGSNGRRCNSKWDLEVHHDKTPFAMGGDNSSANLKLVCAAHNRLESERVYGHQHLKKYYKPLE